MRFVFCSSALLCSSVVCASVLGLLACDGGIGDAVGGDRGEQRGDAQVSRDANAGHEDGGSDHEHDAQAASDGAVSKGDSGGGSDKSDGAVQQGDAGQPAAGSTLIVGVGSWGLRAVSADASTWSYCGEMPVGTDPHAPTLLRDVNYGDGVFIAVGGDGNSMVMRSLDGVHWEEDLHPTTSCDGEAWPPSCKCWMGGVAYGEGTWVAAGGNGAVMRSTDSGKTWTGLHPVPEIRAARDMVFGNGRFVATTDGGVAVSTDKGDSWTSLELGKASLKIAFGGGTFIAWGTSWNGVSLDYECYVSTDNAKSWPACDAAVKEARSFAYDGKQWGASLGGSFATSADGKSWSVQAGNVPDVLLHDGEQWFGVGGQAKSGASLPALSSAAGTSTGVSEAVWVVGRVLDANLPVKGVPACEDNR